MSIAIISTLPSRARLIPTVCDLRAFLFLNLVFGYYVPVSLSKKRNVFLMMYCLLAITINIFGTMFCCIDGIFNISLMLETTELIFYYIMSFHTQFKYLTDYYTLVPITDIASTSNKYFYVLQAILNTTILVYFVFYVFVFAFSITYLNFCLRCGIWGVFIRTINKFTAELGRIPVVLVFCLLYCRVRTFRIQLITEGFEKFGTRWYHKKKYIDMYISICDGLSKLDYPLKYMLSINMLSKFIRIIWVSHNAVKVIRMKVSGTVVIIELGWCMFNALIMFIPAFILEFIMEEIKLTRVYLANQSLACKDVKKRDEMNTLIQYMDERPVQFRLWRILHVNASLPLGALVFFVDILICMLQLQPSTSTTIANATHLE